MILLCQGAGGLWTGLGWVTPCGGQAPISPHGPPRGWWGRQVIVRTEALRGVVLCLTERLELQVLVAELAPMEIARIQVPSESGTESGSLIASDR
jgi:hypothetical protein